MCGIVGIGGARLPHEVAAVLPLIAHRGPDGDGVYADDHVTLGHCRLAIIDPDAGAQPFVDPTGRFVLVYNGELYNHRELRRQLEGRGRVFATNCDTEVLAYWLAEFGAGGLADLNGMFAFAFWDQREQTLLLARDRVGIKPLYLASAGRCLLFASEAKALLPFLGNSVVDAEGLFEFLSFQQLISSRTLFRGVTRMDPGTWAKWTPAGVTYGRYWTLDPQSDFRGSHADAVETYRELLAASVKRQLMSDVPLGAHLSSGLDSSMVASYAAAQRGTPLQTFTGAFAEGDYYDERAGARAVAARINAERHEVEIRASDLVENFARVVWHLEEPTLGTGAVPQFMVAGLAARHVKVVLTGHGGDEFFAGYQVNKAALIRDSIRGGFTAMVKALASTRPDEVTRVLYFLLAPWLNPEVRFGLFAMIPARERSTALAPAFLDRVGRYEPRQALQERIPADLRHQGDVLLHAYVKVYLPTLLCQEDKTSMAHSLESRLPICDNELIDFAGRLSFAQKLHGGRLKSVPLDAGRGLLPDELFQLPKRGFPTPVARWFRKGPAAEFVRDLLLSSRSRQRGIFEPRQLERWLERNRKSRLDTLADYARANRIYSAAVVEQWHRIYEDGDLPVPNARALTKGIYRDRLP